MSATNETTNYNLPLFIGTDKPSWLGDFNGAMNAIDTAIKGRADDIALLQTRMTATETVANTASSNASTALTNASTAQSTADTALANASTADSKATGAQSTANTALTNASNAQTTADTASATATSALTLGNQNSSEIANFNLSTYETIEQNSITSTYGSVGSNMTVAKNSDGSLAKIYGNINITNPVLSNYATNVVKFPTSLRPSSQFTIKNAGIIRIVNNQGVHSIYPLDLTVKTSGECETNGTIYNDTLSQLFMFLPMLYWIKDFGDISTPVE